jgi:hypothetical protein
VVRKIEEESKKTRCSTAVFLLYAYRICNITQQGAIMTVPHQPYRQVHLDFHTALQCEGIGVDFDPEQFASTLKNAHVNAINIFAKCHHGYSYYPTKVGTIHPNLKFDLLGAQIEALHKVGIRCPVYITIKWDDLAGIQHPEWVVVDKEGRAAMRPPLSGGWGWTTLDVASGYGDYVIDQTKEVMDRYDVDGMWFDICFPTPNYSPWGQERMRQAGVDLNDEAAVWQYAIRQDEIFFDRLSSTVRAKKADATFFYNCTVNPEMRRMVPYQTHFEIESLPTSGGAWGYLHYPIMVRQARTYGQDVIGMTGRFHKAWADFGGLKTQDQLDYECGTIVAAGGRICVGDQLHPRGVLDPAVYRLIGKSFERIEKLEPWLEGAVPAAEMAVLGLGKPKETAIGVGSYSAEVEGAAQALMELGIQFNIVDAQADLSGYKAVYVPDGAPVDDALAKRLNEYTAAGGKLIVCGMSGYDPQTKAFKINGVPVTSVEAAPTVPSYLRLDAALAGDQHPVFGEPLASDYDYVFYEQAYTVKAVPGASGMGDLRRALFNRTWEHFTSHQHAPVGDSLNSPLVVCQGNVMYFAAPLFGAYRNHDYWAYRAVAQNALRAFLPPALVKPFGPGWVEFTLNYQGQRRIVHVVCYHPRRSSQSINHVDQSWATHGLAVDVLAEGRVPTKVYLAPDGQELPFELRGEYIHVELPDVGPHTVIVME